MRKRSELRKIAIQNQGLQQQMAGQTDPESSSEKIFEDQVTGIISQYLDAKFPWLRPESSVNIVQVSLKENSLIASVDLTVNDSLIRIPVLYTDGEIVEPFGIFVEGENRFFPLSESWYTKIITSFENQTGSLMDPKSNAVSAAIRNQDKIIEKTDLTGGNYLRYAALEKLDLDEILPLVKVSTANGYVYDIFGREAIHVAANKLMKRHNENHIKKESTFKLNRGYFIVDKDSLSKISGLTLSERVAAYNSYQKNGWAVVDKRPMKKISKIKVIEYEKDLPEHFIDISVLPKLMNEFVGSFDSVTGEPIFYLPSMHRRVDAYPYKNTDADTAEHLRRKFKEKSIIINNDAIDDFNEIIEKIKEDIPKEIKQVINKDISALTSEANENKYNPGYSSKDYLIIPLDKKEKFFASFMEDTAYEFIRSMLDDLSIKKIEGKYLINDFNSKYIIVNKNRILNAIITDFEQFVTKASSLTDYVKGRVFIKRNFNGNRYDLEAENGDNNIKLSYLNKRTAAFILGNFLNFANPVEALDKGTRKYAMNFDPEIISKLEELASDIQDMTTDITQPDQQKEMLDSYKGTKGGVTINIENVNISKDGGPDIVENTPIVSEGSTDQGTSESETQGIPSAEVLIQEALNIGIPQDIIDTLIQIAPSIGISPEELIIEAGSTVEESLSSGIPREQAVAQLRDMINQFIGQAGSPAQAEMASVANIPQEQIMAPAVSPAVDQSIQSAGATMSATAPMIQAPVAQKVADPAMSQVLDAMSLEEAPQMKEALDKSVLSDIIASAAIKSNFIDYIPSLNETIDDISQMILRIEINKSTLTDEVGSAQLDSVVNNLRTILKQLGELVLEIVNFK